MIIKMIEEELTMIQLWFCASMEEKIQFQIARVYPIPQTDDLIWKITKSDMKKWLKSNSNLPSKKYLMICQWIILSIFGCVILLSETLLLELENITFPRASLSSSPLSLKTSSPNSWWISFHAFSPGSTTVWSKNITLCMNKSDLVRKSTKSVRKLAQVTLSCDDVRIDYRDAVFLEDVSYCTFSRSDSSRKTNKKHDGVTKYCRKLR